MLINIKAMMQLQTLMKVTLLEVYCLLIDVCEIKMREYSI